MFLAGAFHITAAPSQGFISTSIPAGIYAEDRALEIRSLQADTILRYGFRREGGGTAPLVPYREPIAMTAAAGEERDYNLIVSAEKGGREVERKELAFRIDKRAPSKPVVFPPPGEYWDPVDASFRVAEGEKVFFRFGGLQSDLMTRWDGGPLRIGGQGGFSENTLVAFSEDGAGNRSPVVTCFYRIDARAPLLSIESPVEGSFANPQILSVTFRNVQWVRYTLDGSDPATGAPYVGPGVIDREGEVVLRVAALPRGSKKGVIRKEVRFSCRPQPKNVSLDVQSGVYPNGIAPHLLTAPDGSLHFALGETSPDEDDPVVSGPIPITALPGARRFTALRMKSLSADGRWGVEYRFFFILDAAKPRPPVISLPSPTPHSGDIPVGISIPEDCLLLASFDGSTPAPASFTNPGTFGVPRSSADAEGVVRIAAVSVNPAGIRSEPVRAVVPVYAAMNVSAPALQATPSEKTSREALVTVKSAGSPRLVYEITSDGSEPRSPVEDSPILPSPLRLSVPFGMERTFKLRAASLDGEGRLSAPGGTLSVEIDRVPPAKPILSPEPGNYEETLRVSLKTEGKVYAALTSDGTMPTDPVQGAGAVTGPMELQASEGGLRMYALKVLCIDELGNTSEVYGPLVYSIDRRMPKLPEVSGISDGGLYGKEKVYAKVGASPWKVRYTASTDRSEPPDPDEGSRELVSGAAFEGTEGLVKSFRIKLLAVSAGGGIKGERKELSFQIDMKPPEVPVLLGAEDNGAYIHPVTITAVETPGDVRLFISSVSTGSEPPDPVGEGEPFSKPLVFDVPPGEEKEFVLRAAAIDSAGNRSPSDRFLRFTVDKKPPEEPVVTGAPEGGRSAGPVTIAISAAGGVYYETTSDGTAPRSPGPGSSKYISPLTFEGMPGQSITYRILARAFDEVGNASREWRGTSFTIDRVAPAPPPEPRVMSYPEAPDVFLLFWDVPTDVRLWYRMKPAAESTGSFKPYLGPVEVPVRFSGKIVVEAYVENRVGMRSGTVSFSMPLPAGPKPPSILGVTEGSVYGGKVEVRILSNAVETRYELSTDGLFPTRVRASSPLVTGPLTLDVGEGEAVRFSIAARSFETEGAASVESVVGFTIDKKPADLPVAVGIEDGGFYQDSRPVELTSADATIFYTASEAGGVPRVPLASESYRYRGTFTLRAREGESVTYRILAFAVSGTGNRSKGIGSWTVTIDRTTVYLSTLGDDGADGTRKRPVKSLSQAIDAAGRTGRNRILVTSGEYTLEAPLSLSSDLSIFGGLEEGTWASTGGNRRTVVRQEAGRPAMSALFTVTGGAVSANGIELQGEARIEGGRLSLSDCFFRLSANAGRAISVSGGSLDVMRGSFTAKAVERGAFISASGGTLSIQETQFAGPSGASEFTCIELRGVGKAVLDSVAIDPGKGSMTWGIKAENSSLSVFASSISTGVGTGRAIGVESTRSDLLIDSSELAANGGSAESLGLLGSDSTLAVSRTRILASGRVSSIGIRARGGELRLTRSTLRSERASEYAYLVSVEKAIGLVSDCLLVAGDSGDSVGLQLADSPLDIFSDTIICGSGSNLTAGIAAQGGSMPRIANSIFARKTGERGTAILLLGPIASSAGLEILTNCYAGWERLLGVDLVRERALSRIEVKRVDALNSYTGEPMGSLIHGNISAQFERLFRAADSGDYHLQKGSPCAGAGIDLAEPPYSAPGLDLDGVPRPKARGWDIGAFGS